jgi:hypothetical protein
MPAKFEFHILEEGQKLERLQQNAQTGLFEYPPEYNLPPVTEKEWQELLEAFVTNKHEAQQKYNQLKQDLIDEAKKNGDDASRLEFDDTFLRVGIGYGVKEFLDLFSEGKTKVRDIVVKPTDTDKERTYQDIFRSDLATPQTKKDYAALKGDSLAEFRNQPYQEPPAKLINDMNSATTPDDAINTVMASQNGMCLDDDHAKPEGKEALTKNMAALKKAGVSTLYIEHFWQEQQHLLDDFLAGGDDDPLPAALAEAVKKLDAPPKDNPQSTATPHLDMLMAAKKNKMRIVGLDDFNAKAPDDKDPRRWEERAARFNKTAADVVKKDQLAHPGKFVLLAGEAHNNTHRGGIPGLSQILGVPALKPTGGKLQISPEDKNNRGMRSENVQIFLDSFIDQLKASNPGSDPEAVLRGADKLARGFGASLDRLTPVQTKSFAQNQAQKSAAKLQGPPQQKLSTPVDFELLATAGGHGSTPLQLAAEQNNPVLIQELLAAGVNVDDVDANGNTALHRLLTDKNKDVEVSSSLLLGSGASLATPNNARLTPLHLALGIKYTTPPFEKWLDDHPDDFKNAAKVKKGNLRVLDLVIARGDASLEDKMYDEGVETDGSLVTLGPNDQLTVPEILAKATVCDDPSAMAGVTQHYTNLYEDFPELRSTMELAALRSMGNRRQDKAIRLVMVNSETPGKVTTDGGLGAYNPKNDSLALGVKRDPLILRGTMIHELTHFAANKVFQNNAQPFAVGDDETRDRYQEALGKDASHDHLSFGDQEAAFQGTLTKRLMEYSSKPKGGVMVNQEAIVGVPQLLVTQGRGLLESKGSNLLEFWEEFTASVRQDIANHPLKDKLKRPATTGQPYLPDNPWFSKDNIRIAADIAQDTVGTVTVAKLASSIMREARYQNGNALDNRAGLGQPRTSSTAFGYPEEAILPVLGSPETANADAIRAHALDVINKGTAYTKPGWYTPIVDDARRIAALPPTTSVDDLRNRAKALNDAANKGRQDGLPFRRALEKIEGKIAEAIEASLKTKDLPPEIYPDVLEAFVRKTAGSVAAAANSLADAIEQDGNLENDDNAIGLLLTDFVKDIKKQVPETVSNLKAAYTRKDEFSEQALKRAAARHKVTNGLPMSDTEFAEAVVLEAAARYNRDNPPSNGLPPEIDKGKQRKLIADIAERIRTGGDAKDVAAFGKYTKFVVDEILYTKGEKKIGKRDQSHVSVAKRKGWVTKLATF